MAQPRARGPGLLGLFLATSCGTLGVEFLRSTLPFLAARLNTPVETLGEIESLSGLLGTLSPLLLGPLGAAHDRRFLVLFGLTLSTLGALTMASCSGLAMAAAAWILFATSDAALRLGSTALALGSQSDGGQSRALGWVSAATGLSWAAVPTFAIVTGARGWHQAWLWMLPLPVIAALAILRADSPGAPGSSPAPAPRLTARSQVEAQWSALRDPALRGLWISIAARGLLSGGVATYWAAFYVHRYRFDVEDVGLTYLISSVGFFLGSMLARWMMDRSGPLRLYVLSTLASGGVATLLFMGLVPTLPSLALVLPFTAASAVASVAQPALLARVTPTPTLSLATASLCSSLGKAGGAALGALLLLRVGYGWMVASLALIAGASLILLTTLTARGETSGA